MLEDVFKLTEKSMIVFSKHEAVIKSCIYGELYICFTTFSLGVGMGEGEESPNIYILIWLMKPWPCVGGVWKLWYLRWVLGLKPRSVSVWVVVTSQQLKPLGHRVPVDTRVNTPRKWKIFLNNFISEFLNSIVCLFLYLFVFFFVFSD